MASGGLAERRSQGILRLDMGKPRRSSGTSVEFRTPSESHHFDVECLSPEATGDKLSVSFGKSRGQGMDKLSLSRDPPLTPQEKESGDEEDYSASVSAILQRRASSRRRRHKPPSPDNERRRSSVFTTSSADTGISVEEGTTQEQILQNIRLHKEVVSSVKHEPWPMRRKMRLVQQAKAYIKRHEGELQERLAMSRSTRHILAHCSIVLVNQWHHLKRELLNLSNVLIPWELRIKEIESHFGSVVASYFTFLRWLFWVNIVIAVVLVTFVVVPEMLTADHLSTGERKQIIPEEMATSRNLITLWNFEGILKYSPIFYGYYTNQDGNGKAYRYRLPLAYFLTGLAVYIYSFVAILRKMAENSRQSKLSEKEDECVFTWKIFTGWDYMIGNAETAHNKTASIILGFKELLLEEAEKIRDDRRNWKMTSLRLCGHMNVLWLLATSVYAVVLVVQRSTEPEAEKSWWRQNEITVVVSLIGFIYPIIFDSHRIIERYHPRKALRLQLARIMALNLLNLYSFIFATFSKINNMTVELRAIKQNVTSGSSFLTTAAYPGSSLQVLGFKSPAADTLKGDDPSSCYRVAVDCLLPTESIGPSVSTALILALSTLANVTSPTTDVSTDVTTDSFSSSSSASYWAWNDPSSPESDTTTSFTETPENITSTLTSFFSQDPLATDPSFQDAFSDLLTTLNTEDINGNYTTKRRIEEFLKTPAIQEFITTVVPESCTKLVCPDITSKSTETFTDYTDQTPRESTANDTEIAQVDFSSQTTSLDLATRKKLRSLCWETMFGQELVKLTIMDLILTIASILMMDFFRAVFVRLMNNCWCWDLEKKFPQYGDFKIAENILHLVNNQGMVWMGMFFSPGLPLINLLKLTIIMYLRSWAVLTCNVPHEVVFRASRSNNFYFALLLTMLFLCVLPVGYAMVGVEPSWHCGPFSNEHRIYQLLTKTIKKVIPAPLHLTLDYIASPGIVIPLLMLLVLIIYYLISLTNALREANNDLKIQLRRERTEERRKMFQLAEKKGRGDMGDTPFAKWRKILPSIPAVKSTLENLGNDIKCEETMEKNKIRITENRNSDFLAKLLKKDLRKSSATSEEGFPPLDEDYPSYEDSEQNEPIEKAPKSKLNNLKGAVKNVLKSFPSNQSIRSFSSRNSQSKGAETEDPKCRERGDSVASGWSTDNIPVIKISESDTSELKNSSSSETITAVHMKEKSTVLDQNQSNEKKAKSKNKQNEKSPHKANTKESDERKDCSEEMPGKRSKNEKPVSSTRSTDPPTISNSKTSKKLKQDDLEIYDLESDGESYEHIPNSIRKFHEMTQIIDERKKGDK